MPVNILQLHAKTNIQQDKCSWKNKQMTDNFDFISHNVIMIYQTIFMSRFVPTCLKAITIVPMLKKSTMSSLNYYRPVTLKPIVMKSFERLVMRHIKTLLSPTPTVCIKLNR